MTIHQKMLQAFYPVLISLTRLVGKNNRVLRRPSGKVFQNPMPPFLINAAGGNGFSLADFTGKKLLLVNTASNCGYTAQYAELEALQRKCKETLQVVGFPSNNFKNQEPAADAQIATFCTLAYGITFPLAKKTNVIGADKHPVYQWLAAADQNGWNSQPPEWNFSKYLVSETGQLTHYFGPSVSPLGKIMQQAIQETAAL